MNHDGRARPGSAPPVREVTDAEVARHAGLVRMVLSKLYRTGKLDRSLEDEDLVQVGTWAVWEALRRWEPEKGAQSTYIHSYVWGFVMKYQRDVVRATGYERVRTNTKGETLGGRIAHVVSLDEPISEDGTTRLHVLACEPAPEDRAELLDAVTRLPDRLRIVGEGMLREETCRDTGQRLGVSQQRVSQLRRQVKARLRDVLAA